jgi:hypothetical protein
MDQSSYEVGYDDEHGLTISQNCGYYDVTKTPELIIEGATCHYIRIMKIYNYTRIITSILRNQHITHILFGDDIPTQAFDLLRNKNIKYLKFICESLNVRYLIDNLHHYIHLKTLLLHDVWLDSALVSKLATQLQRVNISELHVSTSAFIDELITDKLTYFSVYSGFDSPVTTFYKIANNTTITHLSLRYRCSLATVTTDAIANALRHNKMVKRFEYCSNDVVSDTINSAISESTSIKQFKNECFDDYNSLKY